MLPIAAVLSRNMPPALSTAPLRSETRTPSEGVVSAVVGVNVAVTTTVAELATVLVTVGAVSAPVVMPANRSVLIASA